MNVSNLHICLYLNMNLDIFMKCNQWIKDFKKIQVKISIQQMTEPWFCTLYSMYTITPKMKKKFFGLKQKFRTFSGMRYNAWIILIWPALLWPLKLSWNNKRIIEWKLHMNQMVLSLNEFDKGNTIKVSTGIMNFQVWYDKWF